MAWLRLIRWPNLLIVAGTQAVAWWCVIRPLGGPLVLTPGHFSLLCLSTVLIAAGGYIINDYFDIRIDAINKPEKMILDRIIPRRLAIIVHSVVNAVALALAAVVALPAGHPEWLLLQIGCTALLWRYSTTWKRQFMIGNVVVALMTGLTIGELVLYEPFLYQYIPSPTLIFQDEFRWRINPVRLLAAFAFFAFFLTWMREIVKDMEDFKGDEAEGCITMPIKWGLLKSSRFVQLLASLILLMLVYSFYQIYWIGMAHPDYRACIIALVFLAVMILMVRFPLRATKQHYAQASLQLKLIMVTGIIALLFYRY